MQRLPVVMRTPFAWVMLIVAGVVLLFLLAIVIGLALTALSFWGPAVAFALVVLVAGVVVGELGSLWPRLPR